MQTFEQYGGGYKACLGCSVQNRINDLVDGRCVKCRPVHTCISCLIVLDTSSGTVIFDNVWKCNDTAACAERVWRVAAKAAERADDFGRMHDRGATPVTIYRHHNADCDYVNGAWICPNDCAVTNRC